MINLSTLMVYDLPWCSLVGRNVKREQTLCVRLNRVIVGKLENNITGGRSARAPPVAIQKFHIAVPPQGTLYITAKRPNHVTPD